MRWAQAHANTLAQMDSSADSYHIHARTRVNEGKMAEGMKMKWEEKKGGGETGEERGEKMENYRISSEERISINSAKM